MRAITVIGPSGSGKTTLVKALASLEGSRSQSLKLMGDFSVTTFEYMGDKWAALDIPGGQDNFSQIGPALTASDAAVLCVPAEADAAVLAAPYLRILEETGMPVFMFVNKMDVAADRVSDIVSALQRYCRHGIVLRQVPIRSGNEIVGAIDLISERAWEYREGKRSSLVEVPQKMLDRKQEARAELLESLADFDDNLLEQIIEDRSLLTDDVYEVATRVLQRHDLVLSFLGAASHGNGIQRLMKSLRHEAPQCDALRERLDLPSDVLAASCYADHLKHVGKATLIRALGDGVQSSCRLGGGTVSNLNAIDAKTPVSSIATGEFALAIKSDHVAVGNFCTPDKMIDLPVWTEAHPAALSRLVEPVHEKDDNKLSSALARLAEIDAGLTLAQNETSGLLQIGVQGPLHLRRTIEKLAETYGIKVECSDVPTAFRETIRKGTETRYRHKKQSGGAGQFADVVVAIAPGVRGSDFEFNDTVKGGAVPRNYIPSVEFGARDALKAGPSGFPVVDLRVTLLDGKTHSVDSSDFAFQMAGKSAVREALSEVGTIVLQPILKLEVHVPSIFAGGLVQLASGLKGQVVGFEAHPTATGWDVFRTLLPMASQEEFSRALGGATRGTAWFDSKLDHYEETREYAAAD